MIAIIRGASTSNITGSIAIGESPNVGVNNAIAIGTDASCAGAVTIGYDCITAGTNSVVVGEGSSDGGFSNCAVVGSNLTATFSNQFLTPATVCYQILSTTTAQSISDATDTSMTIWTGAVKYNIGGITINSGTSFIIPVSGVYLVSIDNFYFAYQNTTGYRRINILQIPVSGSNTQHGFTTIGTDTGGEANYVSLSVAIPCITGDTLQVHVYQTSGLSINCGSDGTASKNPILTITRLI